MRHESKLMLSSMSVIFLKRFQLVDQCPSGELAYSLGISLLPLKRVSLNRICVWVVGIPFYCIFHGDEIEGGGGGGGVCYVRSVDGMRCKVNF